MLENIRILLDKNDVELSRSLPSALSFAKKELKHWLSIVGSINVILVKLFVLWVFSYLGQ